MSIAACQSNKIDSQGNAISSTQFKVPVAMQIIIKFKPNTLACRPADIAQLAQATQVSLEYLRPMSGNSCVLRQLAEQASKIAEGQSILKRHPAVEWLEPDQMMQPQ